MVAPFHLRLVQDIYLFSDYLHDDPASVMGAGETTAFLYHAGRPARAVDRALDLGCGAGTLALLLARDVRESVGADINPRAVALATWNAAVNGIANARFVTGDAFAPVHGERFDVILSQPPYYPNPGGGAHELKFLHGGPRGDEIARRIVAGIPSHLAPGGRAIVFASWPDGCAPEAPAGWNMREWISNRIEPHTMRRSLTVIEHAANGEGWTLSSEVPADTWGALRGRRIDQALEAEALLRGPEVRLLAATLRFPEGAFPFEEESRRFLRCPPESLVGMTPIDADEWNVISAVNAAATVETALGGAAARAERLGIVKAALRRGLLTIYGSITSK